MKDKYEATIHIEPVDHLDYANYKEICRREGFRWYNLLSAVRKTSGNLTGLAESVDTIVRDLRAAKIQVRHVRIVEKILDEEVE